MMKTRLLRVKIMMAVGVVMKIVMMVIVSPSRPVNITVK